MEEVSLQILLKHYTVLHELYEKLEVISKEVFQDLQSGSRIGELAPRLRKNAVVADRISEESRKIVSMKKTLTEQNLLADRDRALVRESEQHLKHAVNRVVEQETRNSELLMKQGVKISRK